MRLQIWLILVLLGGLQGCNPAPKMNNPETRKAPEKELFTPLSCALEITDTVDGGYKKICLLIDIADKYFELKQNKKGLQVLSLILEITKATSNESDNTWALTRIAEKFIEYDEIDKALEAAEAIYNSWEMIQFLSTVIKKNPTPKQISKILELAKTIEYEDKKVYILDDILNIATRPEQLTQILEIVETLNPKNKTWLMSKIISKDATPEQFNQLLETAKIIKTEETKASTLIEIAEKFKKPEQITQILEAAKTIRYDKEKLEVLTNIGGKCTKSEQINLILETSKIFESEYYKTKLLISIADKCKTPEQTAQILKTMDTLNPRNKTCLMSKLTSTDATPEQFKQLLKTAEKIKNETARTSALIEIAGRFKKPEQTTRIFKMIENETILPDNVKTLINLARHFSTTKQNEKVVMLLSSALKAAGSHCCFFDSLLFVGDSCLEMEQFSLALKAAKAADKKSRRVRRRYELQMVSKIAVKYIKTGQTEKAFEVIETIDQENTRANFLTEFAKTCHELNKTGEAVQTLQRALLVGVTDKNRVGEIWVLRNVLFYLFRFDQEEKAVEVLIETFNRLKNEKDCSKELCYIASRLIILEQKEKGLEVLNWAFKTATDIKHESSQAQTLHEIADNFYQTGQKEKSIQVLEKAMAIEKPGNKFSTLISLIEKYSEIEQKDNADQASFQASKIIREIKDKGQREYFLETLASKTTDPESLPLMLKRAELIEDKNKRVEIMSIIACRYNELDQKNESVKVFSQALELIKTISDKEKKVKALCFIAEKYGKAGFRNESIHVLSQALEIADTIEWSCLKSWSLSKIATKHAELKQFQKAGKIAKTIEDGYYRVRALEAIVDNRTDLEQYLKAIETAMTIKNGSDIDQALYDISFNAIETKNFLPALQAVKEIEDKEIKVKLLISITDEYNKTKSDTQFTEKIDGLLKDILKREQTGWEARKRESLSEDFERPYLPQKEKREYFSEPEDTVDGLTLEIKVVKGILKPGRICTFRVTLKNNSKKPLALHMPFFKPRLNLPNSMVMGEGWTGVAAGDWTRAYGGLYFEPISTFDYLPDLCGDKNDMIDAFEEAQYIRRCKTVDQSLDDISPLLYIYPNSVIEEHHEIEIENDIDPDTIEENPSSEVSSDDWSYIDVGVFCMNRWWGKPPQTETEHNGKKYKMWYGGLYVTMFLERNYKAFRLSYSYLEKERLEAVELLKTDGSALTLKRLEKMMKFDKSKAVQKAAKKAYESLKTIMDQEQKDFQERNNPKEIEEKEKDKPFVPSWMNDEYDDYEYDDDEDNNNEEEYIPGWMNDDDDDTDDDTEEDDDAEDDEDEDDGEQYVPFYER